MTKNDRLNNLFKEWENSVELYRGRFKKDGINDVTLFEKAKCKILFITKEPNNPKQTEGDYRKWWKEGIKYTFSQRIAEWSYGVLNDFPHFEQSWVDTLGFNEAMQSISFMNIKKLGGGGSSKFSEIYEHLIQNKEYLLKQIGIIDPNIIITGLTWKALRNELFETVEWKHSGHNVAIGRFGKAKVIDFYHPSSRNAAAASYSLLQNVIESEAFRKLLYNFIQNLCF